MMGNEEIKKVNFLLEKHEWGAAIAFIKQGLRKKRFRNTAEAFRLLGHAYMRIDHNKRAGNAFAEAKFIDKCRAALSS
jgi:predicted Zn-dependent protease